MPPHTPAASAEPHALAFKPEMRRRFTTLCSAWVACKSNLRRVRGAAFHCDLDSPPTHCSIASARACPPLRLKCAVPTMWPRCASSVAEAQERRPVSAAEGRGRSAGRSTTSELFCAQRHSALCFGASLIETAPFVPHQRQKRQMSAGSRADWGDGCPLPRWLLLLANYVCSQIIPHGLHTLAWYVTDSLSCNVCYVM